MKDNMLFQNKKTLKQCKESVKMKKLLSIVLILGIVVTLTGCSLIPSKSGRTNVGGGTVVTPQVNLSDKITSNGALTKRNRLVVFAKNNNNIVIDLTIEVEFYDANNALVSSGKEYLYGVGSGAEVAVEIYDTPSSFNSYKIYADAEETSYTKTFFDSIELSHNRADKVVAQVKNNSTSTIDTISAAVVYYQGTTVVGYDEETAFDVKPGRSGNLNFFEPYDNNYDDVEYDNYKVFINEAYSYSY